MSSRPIVIHGGMLLSPGQPARAAVDVHIGDGRITAVTAAGEVGDHDAEIIDARDSILIPGLVNAHTHSHLAFAKGIHDRWTLELHLNGGPWTNVLLTHAQRRLAVLLSAAEMISKGCTAAYDLHFEIPEPTAEGMATVADAYREIGLRALIAPMLADRSIWTAVPGLLEAAAPAVPPGVAIARPPRSVVAHARRLVRGWRYPQDEAGLALAPTIPHHCSDGLLEGMARLSREDGAALHMHLAESKVQAVAGDRLYDRSLTAHIAALGLLSERFTAAHAVWIEDGDMDLLAEHGAMVAHNPISNLRLGSGIAAVRRLLDRGVRLGIGTDASSCADGLNMFEATRAAKLVSHVMGADPARWLTSEEAFRMATEGGARLLGLEGKLGRIEAGFLADLVFIDRRHLNYIPLNDALRQIVHLETGAAVHRVMIGGRTVYQDRQFTTIDIDALRRQMETAVEDIRSATAERRRMCEALEPVLTRTCLCMTAAPRTSERRFECV